MSSGFLAAVIILSDFRAQEEEICHFYTFSPSICPEVMELDAMILAFLIFSFKLARSLSCFNLIKKLFSSSLFSAIRVVSPAYLRLLMLLLPILIPVCNLSSPAFLMMYSVDRNGMDLTGAEDIKMM